MSNVFLFAGAVAALAALFSALFGALAYSLGCFAITFLCCGIDYVIHRAWWRGDD